jgi:hypothetical protein
MVKAPRLKSEYKGPAFAAPVLKRHGVSRRPSLWHFRDRPTRTLKGLASTGHLREARKRAVSRPFFPQSRQKGRILPLKGGFSGVFDYHLDNSSCFDLVRQVFDSAPLIDSSERECIRERRHFGWEGVGVIAFIGFRSAAPRREGAADIHLAET